MSDPTFVDAGVHDTSMGQRVTIVMPVNLYGCSLGEDCFVGPFVEIQRNVSVGPRTRIQSHSFICELVTIGTDCFIGHGAMFINDRFSDGKPAGGNATKWEPTTLGDRVFVGSNATILPVSICSDVVVGAGSVVTKNITEPGIYAGNPAKLIRRMSE